MSLTSTKARVRRSERRHHQLGDADRKLPHAGGDDRGAAAAANAEDRTDVVTGRQEPREGLAHGSDRTAAVRGGGDSVGAIGMEGGHGCGCDFRNAGGWPRADVDDHRIDAGGGHGRAHVGRLLALGVLRPDNVHALHRHPSDAPALARRCGSRPVKVGQDGRRLSSRPREAYCLSPVTRVVLQGLRFLSGFHRLVGRDAICNF